MKMSFATRVIYGNKIIHLKLEGIEQQPFYYAHVLYRAGI